MEETKEQKIFLQYLGKVKIDVNSQKRKLLDFNKKKEKKLWGNNIREGVKNNYKKEINLCK